MTGLPSPATTALWSLAIVLQVLLLVRAQDLNALREALAQAGVQAVFPGDETYANASAAYNTRYTIYPVAVTYPSTSEQVSAVVSAGAAQGLDVTTRSGGHSYVAGGLGGKNGSLVVDLGSFKSIEVDEETDTVTVGPGARLGDVARILNDYGRALPHGRCTTVGVGGHATGGGWGHHSRMWGLLLDRAVAETVVLSNGSIVTASEEDNADLFWGLRGAGASLGIVTSFVFATEPVPPLGGTTFQYNWNMTAAEAAASLSTFQDFVQSGIPATLGGELILSKGTVPGNIGVQFMGVHWDDPATFNDTIAPYMSLFRQPDSSNVTSGDWITVLAAWAFGNLDTSTMAPYSDAFYAKSLLTPEREGISGKAIDAFVNYLATDGFDSDVTWFAEIELYGGSNSALNAVPLDKTAFAHRDKLFNMQLYATTVSWEPPFSEDGLAFVDGMANSIIQNEAAVALRRICELPR
ncbi:FAD-binding domain-containing protein [Schizophyllum commune H4-8]|uniref:FAD-binding domain-containing protein n=1 Tax=Schizophyllum commune (strain H4-8 / FGSC 9210) TaxID=578458 RepID=UPI00215FA857|nr:FAD-binding domain-containing protein [Schizophyllum commune H4-8]KAI5895779.1 FAD-binding domain-containing protein [Schizophyllum commune H4-8]